MNNAGSFISVYIGRSPKQKWMILGYPYFRKFAYLDKLRPITTFKLVKFQSIRISEVFFQGQDQKNNCFLVMNIHLQSYSPTHTYTWGFNDPEPTVYRSHFK